MTKIRPDCVVHMTLLHHEAVFRNAFISCLDASVCSSSKRNPMCTSGIMHSVPNSMAVFQAFYNSTILFLFPDQLLALQFEIIRLCLSQHLTITTTTLYTFENNLPSGTHTSKITSYKTPKKYPKEDALLAKSRTTAPTCQSYLSHLKTCPSQHRCCMSCCSGSGELIFFPLAGRESDIARNQPAH